MKRKIVKILLSVFFVASAFMFSGEEVKAETRWVTFHIGNEIVGFGNVITLSNFSVVPSLDQKSTAYSPGASRSFRVYGFKRATVAGAVYYRTPWGEIRMKEFTRFIDIPDKGYFIYVK